MLPSGAELPRSFTGRETCKSCWVQLVASWMAVWRTAFHSRTMELTWHWCIWPSGLGMVMWRQAASCWQKSQTDWSLMFPMWRTPNEEAACWWPTLCHGSVPHITVSAWMLREPGRWTGKKLMPIQSQNLRRRNVRQVSLNDLVPPSLFMYDTTTVLSHIKHTTWDCSWGRNLATLRSTASSHLQQIDVLACPLLGPLPLQRTVV